MPVEKGGRPTGRPPVVIFILPASIDLFLACICREIAHASTCSGEYGAVCRCVARLYLGKKLLHATCTHYFITNCSGGRSVPHLRSGGFRNEEYLQHTPCVFLSACAAGIFFYAAAGIVCAASEPQAEEQSDLQLPLEIALLIGLCLFYIVGWSLVLRRKLHIAVKGFELCGEQLLEVRQSVARMEKSTTSLNALLHGILDAIPDLIFFKDAQGQVMQSCICCVHRVS